MPLSRIENPLGTFENVRLYVSAAGPRFWIEARKAVGSCAPLNGTVNCGSVATVKWMPGCVGVIVTSTVVWASRLESVCDWAMIWIG